MALSYIPQAQRFIIVEGLGCAIALLNSYPAIFLVYIWPVVLGTISIVYGCKYATKGERRRADSFSVIAIKYFLARRLQFQTLLKSSQSGLNSGQYFRLMAMASADLIIGMPLNIAILITKAQHVDAWPGISRVYENWGYVREVSADAVDIYYNDPAGTTLSVLSGWFAPLLAFLFFIFFGVTQDAVREYSRWYPALMRRFGFAEPAQ